MSGFYIHNIDYCLTCIEFCKMILIPKIKPKLLRINQCLMLNLILYLLFGSVLDKLSF